MYHVTHDLKNASKILWLRWDTDATVIFKFSSSTICQQFPNVLTVCSLSSCCSMLQMVFSTSVRSEDHQGPWCVLIIIRKHFTVIVIQLRMWTCAVESLLLKHNYYFLNCCNCSFTLCWAWACGFSLYQKWGLTQPRVCINACIWICVSACCRAPRACLAELDFL